MIFDDALFGLPGTFDLSTEPGLSGLCMTVDASTVEAVTWISPDRYITLKDNTAYRVTVTAATDQTAFNAIPFWDMTYDNFSFIPGDPPAPFLNFGGSQLFIDVAGGSACLTLSRKRK